MARFRQPMFWLVAVLVLMMFVSACTGQGRKGTDGGEVVTPPPPASTEGTPQPSEKPEGLTLPLTTSPITYSYFITERADAPIKDDWAIIKEMEKRTGVDIKFEPAPGNTAAEKKMILIATGSIPDIFSNIMAEEARQYGPEGLFLNFKPFMEQGLMPNVSKWFEKYPDAATVSTAPDGGIYAIPVFAEEDYISFSWMGRKDIMEPLGLQMPKNTEEFYQVLKKLKEAYPDSYPFIFQMSENDPMTRYGLFREFTQMFTETDGIIGYNTREDKYVFAAEMPEFKEMLLFLNKLYTEKLMDPEFALMPPGQMDERLLTDKSFVTFHFKGRIDNYNVRAKQADANATFDMQPMQPFALQGKEAFQFIKPVVFDQNNIALSAKVKHPEIAVQFIDYLYSEEGTDLTNLGIQGLTYEIVDGKPRYLPELEQDLVATLRKDFGVVYDGIRMAGANKTQDARTKTETIILTDEMHTPFTKPTPPYKVPTEEENELEKEKRPNLIKHFEQNLTEFVMGKRPITDENIEKFIEQSNRLGTVQLVEAYNNQHNRSR
ncbi:extracellular solute-binding protein [Paenibacillus tarimensis]